jgi:hypothetical protein
VNNRRARGCLRSMVSMMDILPGAVPLMADVHQSGSSPMSWGASLADRPTRS